MTAKTWVYCHNEYHINRFKKWLDRTYRCCRLNGDTCLDPPRMYFVNNSLRIISRLIMKSYKVSSKICVVINISDRITNHEMNVYWNSYAFAHTFQKRFAKTYISHKHSVHDIIMNPVNTSVLSTLYLERKV